MNKIKLTRKQHNNYFPKRKLKCYMSADHYIDKELRTGEIYYCNTLWAKILITIVFPVFLLLGGLLNFKKYWQDLIDIWDNSVYNGLSDNFPLDMIEEDS